MSDTKDKKEDKKTHHPPFDGDDFEMWMERIMLKLQRKGLWEYCESEVTEPGESKEADHSKWLTESQRTREYLYDGMSDKIMKTVKYESTPCRIMERLKRRFVGKTYFKYAEEEVKLRQLRLYVNGNIHTPSDANDAPNYEQLEQTLELAHDRRQGRKVESKVETQKIRLSLPVAAVVVDEEPDDVAVVVADAVSVVVVEQIKVVVAGPEQVKGTTVLMVVTKVVLRSEAATTAMIKDIKYDTALFSANVPLRKAKQYQRRSATRLVEKEKVPSPAIRLVMEMKVMITLTLP
ncbi:hypothetical protein PF004_g134 [Phytophthora fragariae]|uniref:DUF4219 domain-containing protein n=1 Tax=Phytophthora fragariae TaxID=53985 RepID=A0A6A3MFW5_9STRA|nr:hypothetical protein PF011_g617 [Phytophthora fragariae]KAE9256301.1 hypothetical protein PF004_g134 [Phytophthora fragariae]